MKTFFAFSIASLLVGAICYSQPPQNDRDNRRPGPPPQNDRDGDFPGRPPRGDRNGGPPGRPPVDPFFHLFDTDRNGELSMKEIDAAPAILKKRDRDRNGVLTPDEMPRPPRPGDHRRPGEGPRPDEDRRGQFDQKKRGDRDGGPPPRRDFEDGEQGAQIRTNATKGTVLFRGGYQTDPQDRGRPVALIAAALGVKSKVFRDAFSNVNPARGGDPSPQRAQANKKVLMDALGKYGITNERLDTVSNYYRYQPGRGEIWKRTPASATAKIQNGKVVGFIITNPGSGYTSAPHVSVAGYDDLQVESTIAFNKDFRKNGSINSLSIVE